MKAVEDYRLNFVGTVPEDPDIQKFDLNGRPTVELGKDSIALKAAYNIFQKLFEK